MTDEQTTGASALDELLAGRALTEDAARPEKVARRHAAGGRTARENIADLVVEGTFVEYGRFVTAAQVPLVGVVVRRGYGLGAQAMLGGSTHQPLMTIAWPDAHLGPMGLEGAVRLAMRAELEAIEDPEGREQTVRELTSAYREHARTLNAARMFEIDDVVDPAQTRPVVAATFAAAAAKGGVAGSGRPVDTW